jgi:hypothetical protein
MNDQEKKDYLERYHQQKEKGVPFFPDIIFKDALISLVVFLILVALAYFVGAPLEARANRGGCHSHPGDLAAIFLAANRPELQAEFLEQTRCYRDHGICPGGCHLPDRPGAARDASP